MDLPTDKLLQMPMHDSVVLKDGLEVVRVPGGWLYRSRHFDREKAACIVTSQVFVPEPIK